MINPYYIDSNSNTIYFNNIEDYAKFIGSNISSKIGISLSKYFDLNELKSLLSIEVSKYVLNLCESIIKHLPIYISIKWPSVILKGNVCGFIMISGIMPYFVLGIISSSNIIQSFWEITILTHIMEWFLY